MKVAIISDIHNNLANLKKVLDYFAKENIQKIICCGDLASMETLDFLNDNLPIANGGSTSIMEVEPPGIYFCFGNMDEDYLKNYSFKCHPELVSGSQNENMKIFQDFGEIKIGNKNIAFVHYPQKAKELAETGKYDFVFYGHTHKPWTEVINNCAMLNPGNVAGEIYPPTFAVWNTEDNKFKLIRIHDLK